MGIEFVPDRSSLEPAPDVAKGVELACRDRGLLVQTVSENVWRPAPPITVTDAEIDTSMAIIHEALEAVAPR